MNLNDPWDRRLVHIIDRVAASERERERRREGKGEEVVCYTEYKMKEREKKSETAGRVDGADF